MMVAVTGVSGSGKSTLMHEVIYQNLAKRMNRESPVSPDEAEAWGLAPEKLTCQKVENAELLTAVVLVDQTPIGRTPRSNPVTYIKAFDLIRDLFAKTPEADRRGYTAGHFSFNIPGGRCETCQGDGTVTVEMQFLADVELVCDDCKGTRFKQTVLDVKYRGLNIHEVLAAHGEGSDFVFCGYAAAGAEAASAGRCRVGLFAAGAVGHNALGGRGAAGEAGGAFIAVD